MRAHRRVRDRVENWRQPLLGVAQGLLSGDAGPRGSGRATRTHPRRADHYRDHQRPLRSRSLWRPAARRRSRSSAPAGVAGSRPRTRRGRAAAGGLLMRTDGSTDDDPRPGAALHRERIDRGASKLQNDHDGIEAGDQRRRPLRSSTCALAGFFGISNTSRTSPRACAIVASRPLRASAAKCAGTRVPAISAHAASASVIGTGRTPRNGDPGLRDRHGSCPLSRA